MLPFAVTIFVSAFLLFQVQPIIARMILPWFGGTAAVWATCLVFFQLVLLGGYLYAHGVISRMDGRRQRYLHLILLAAALLSLPITPSVAWKPIDASDPLLRILGLLAITIGLPYFLLTTTGPLLQAWFAQSRPGQSPYRLFALSNAGSMLGLLTYPVLVEPNLTAQQQSWMWSGGFVLFVALCALTALRSRPASIPLREEVICPADEAEPPNLLDRAIWILLALCPSLLLLAITGHLTEDVASIPFLWILPLAIYLLSFILCFDVQGWYQRKWFLPLLVPALGAMSYFIWTDAEKPSMWWIIVIFAVSYFVICMFCHGELARNKPHPRYLTGYFLMISIGGALGGLFVALVAPTLFNAKYESAIGLGLTGLLAVVILVRAGDEILPDGLLGWRGIAVLTVFSLLSGWLVRVVHDRVVATMVVERNFYGELRVRQHNGYYDWEGYRVLIHGTINHGEQWTHPARRKTVSTYYCADSGVGLVMKARVVGNPLRVGVIGLGTGTLALYANPGDAWRFYDINPLVQKIANSEFTYLKDAEAQVEVVLGDARLSMEREEPQRFDILVLDAFSGDSIPIHLLTREAMQLYRRHMSPDAVLAVHISNRYLDLQPVLASAGDVLGMDVRVVETDDNEDGNCFGTTWILCTAKNSMFERAEFQKAAKPLKPVPGFRPWTDNYSSLYSLLK